MRAIVVTNKQNQVVGVFSNIAKIPHDTNIGGMQEWHIDAPEYGPTNRLDLIEYLRSPETQDDGFVITRRG